MSDPERSAHLVSGGSKKERSPSFPFITLTKAIERVQAIYAAAKRHEARLPEIAAAIGCGAKSSGTLQTVAALMAFGLLEDSGSGEARKFRVTDLSFKLLEDQRPGVKEVALREAALKPRLIAEYSETWQGGRPSDPICVSELRVDRGFTLDGAKAFLQVFDDAITYTASVGGDKMLASDSNTASDTDHSLPDKKVEIGDLVQWEAQGVLRLERPTAVRAIHEHEGREWVFVNGSETGMPMEEIVIEQKVPSQRAQAPTLPLPTDPSRQALDASQPGMDVDRFTVDEGVVRVEFPKGMGAASVEELDEFFKLFIKKAKRRAIAAAGS